MFIVSLYLILLIDKNEFLVAYVVIFSLLWINCLKIRANISINKVFLFFSLLITFIYNFPISLNIYFFLFILYLFEFDFRFKTKSIISPILLIYIIMVFQFLTFFEVIDYNIINNLIGVGRQMHNYTGQPISSMRAMGLFGNPNYSGIVTIIIYYLCLQIKQKPGMLFHIFVLCSIVTTGSRAALLSFIILNFFTLIKNRSISINKIFYIVSLLISIFLFKILNLRVLYFEKLTEDKSYSARVDNIEVYFNDLYEKKELTKFLFGNGSRDQLIYFFDGDLGNLFFSLGIFGMSTFLFLIFKKLQKIHSQEIFYALLPVFFAGGIFGNYKTFFFFIFLPGLITYYRTLKV